MISESAARQTRSDCNQINSEFCYVFFTWSDRFSRGYSLSRDNGRHIPAGTRQTPGYIVQFSEAAHMQAHFDTPQPERRAVELDRKLKAVCHKSNLVQTGFFGYACHMDVWELL